MNFADRVEAQFPDWQYGHPKVLYGLIRSMQPIHCVEVGTYRGYAACWMAQALKENGKGHLYCIDDFSEGMQKKYDADHWRANIAALDLTDWVTLIVGKSSMVEWPKSVDFAYIDGWHGYATCMGDFLDCSTRGAECVCFDDIISTVGPRNAITEVKEWGWDAIEILRDCGLAVCIRRKPKPRCNFSQEIPDHPGTIMTGWSEKEIRDHLLKASKKTGLNYDRFEV